MQKSFFFIVALLMGVNTLSAQFEYGLRFGASTQGVNTDQILLQSNDFNDLRLSLSNAAYGYHAGLYAQIKMLGMTISPEVNFNSNRYEYKIQEISDGEDIVQVFKDSYQYIDIPLLFGVKLGPFRAYGGPEAHYFVNSYSELVGQEGFDEQIEKLNYGAIVGAGLNMGRLRFDVRYEINFDDFEDHIFYQDNRLNFNSDDSRLIFSAGWKFN